MQNLIQTFKEYDLGRLADYSAYVSSKSPDGTYFAPYVPLVGRNFATHRVLVYGTAQNLSPNGDGIQNYAQHLDGLVERLYFSWDFSRNYPTDELGFKDIAIAPYRQGVLPALVGVFLYARFKLLIEKLDDIHNYIALSNYYKFSLSRKKSDLNPNTLEHPKAYWDLNDELVDLEIRYLNPDTIITFKGRHCHRLSERFNVVLVNDPAWILRGGGGVLTSSGSWGVYTSDIANHEAIKLIERYSGSLTERYKAKNDAVKIYLKKYYKDWTG